MSVLSGFGQADGSRVRGFQLEIDTQVSSGCTGQGDCGLVAGAGHIPDVVSGSGSGGQIPGGLKYRRGRNTSALGDGQGVAALGEFCAIPIGKGEVREDAIAVIDAGCAACQGDGRCAGTGCRSEAGDFLCGLNGIHQCIVVRGKIRNTGFTGIVENVAGGTAFVDRVAFKGGGVAQTADNFVDQKLGGNPQWDIGVAVLFRGGDADGMIPHLVTVQQN